MAEPEFEILELGAGFLGEDTRQDLDIVEFKRLVEEFLN